MYKYTLRCAWLLYNGELKVAALVAMDYTLQSKAIKPPYYQYRRHSIFSVLCMVCVNLVNTSVISIY